MFKLNKLLSKLNRPQKRPGKINRLCYIHIYKCGGSSMREYIKQHFTTLNTTVIDQWAYEWENHITPPHRYLGNITRSEYLRYRVLSLRSKSALIMTHSFFYEFMKQWSSFSFATLLRDPVKRIISQFNFSKRTFEHDKDTELGEWLESKTSFEYNLQTAALCGNPSLTINEAHLENAKTNLHFFDFIGFVDQFELSIMLFNRIYSIRENVSLPRINVTPKAIQISDKLNLLLQERCKYDLELITYAQDLFKAKLAAWEMLETGNLAGGPSILVS